MFFTGVWVTASLIKSPGLFSVFWPFSIMLSFGWSPPSRQLPSPPVPLVILQFLFQTHQLQLVYLSHACSTAFSIPYQGQGTYPCFHILSVLFYDQPGQQSRLFFKFSSFYWLSLSLVFWPRLSDPCVCRSPIGVYVCHFLGQVLGCAYTISL